MKNILVIIFENKCSFPDHLIDLKRSKAKIIAEKSQEEKC